MTKHTHHIVGSVEVDDAAVTTHKDSYLLSNITVASVRRPLLAPAILLSCALSLFAIGFFDLLYPVEVTLILMLNAAAIMVGLQIAQLKLLSRDLRGSELGDVIWGRHGALQLVRRDVVGAIRSADKRSSAHDEVRS